MALLKSATNSPGVDFFDYRDELYYSKYRYRARYTIEGLRRGYYWGPDEFESKLKNKKLWGHQNITKDELDTINQNLLEIKKILQFREDHKKVKSVTIRTEHNTMAVFSNDLQALHAAFDGATHAVVDYTEVQSLGYVGVKTFVKEPKHKYRVYLKSRKAPEDFREKFGNILKTNPKLKPSPAFMLWMKSVKQSGYMYWHNWLNATHFIDYDDESYLSYLALMYGEFLGKKYKLEKRPDIV